ncbi:MAG: M23 family metallopeptidase [Leptospirales bacterium]
MNRFPKPKITSTLALIVFFLYVPAFFGTVKTPYTDLPLLTSVEYKDANLQQHRNEVKTNLEKQAQGNSVKPYFRKYFVKKDDSFFLVMTRTMLDHDTLSSVNQLASLWDVETGRYWLIPNTRGISVFGDRSQIAQKYNITPGSVIAVPGYKDLYFIPGRSFAHEEKEYLNLSVFSRPVVGRITSNYGYRNDPFGNKSKFHKGVDIGCPIGTNVIAAAPGIVIYANTKGGYGNLVIIEHRNGYQSLYGHLSKFKVTVGQKVERGQTIALSGNTGRSTGPHIHFEIKRKGKPVQPHFSRN